MAGQTPVISTIRSRLVLLTFGLLLPGLLIGAFLLWDSYRNSRAAFERQLMETAHALSLVVDRELGQAAASTRALATSSYLQSGNLRLFDRQARRVQRNDNTWIVLFDESGRIHVNTSSGGGAGFSPTRIETQNLWPDLRQRSTVVSNLFGGTAAATPVVAVSAPVEVDDRVRYGLAFVMMPNVFSNIIAEQQLPQGWIGTILDGDLSVVAHSSGGGDVIGAKPQLRLQEAMNAQNNGVLESPSIEGAPGIVAFSRSPLHRWSFAVFVPREQVTETITRSLVMAGLGGLILLILGALVAMHVARTISGPVESLVDVAGILGRGGAVPALETPIAEVNAVSNSLREAAKELAARTSDLRESESRLRLAVEATDLGIWDVDLVSGSRSWSGEFRRILGLDQAAEADPEAFLARVHPADQAWVGERYESFCNGTSEESYDAEFRIVLPSTGEERWVYTSGRLVRDGNGIPVRATGTIMDVTERRRVEENLRESELRFRSMADSAPALIWMTDASGEIVFLNRYHESFFGRPVQDLCGSEWTRVIHPDDLRAFFAEFHEAVQGRRSWRREVRVRDGKGSTRWLRCEGAPRIIGGSGQFLGYVGCNVDITESKLAADAMERRIDERTGELAAANRQLRSQIEERERVEETLRQVQRLEAVGQLTSGVAHDFNNLLTVILGNLSFAERSVSDAPLRKRLSNMRMAAERGASLVSQLLAFSRRQRLEPKTVNLNETVGGMRELLQSSMGGTVAVDIVLEDELWPALVDPTQIELIILNLAINARDAMDVGGMLRVQTSNVRLRGTPERPEEPAPGDYVCVAVSDSGAGISEDVLARVFEPFFTTKDVGKGSGLGLSQVLGFAKQSGGGVRIETEEGKGTTVYVFVPRAAGSLPKTGTKAGAAPAPARAAPAILIVDDDDLVRDVTSSKLEEFGYRVIQASSGPSALLELEQNDAVSLLILDFAMPGMNGAEVARAARKRRPGIPLMFLTGYADFTALGEFAAEPILHKPFRDDELGRRVAALLKRGKARQSASA